MFLAVGYRVNKHTSLQNSFKTPENTRHSGKTPTFKVRGQWFCLRCRQFFSLDDHIFINALTALLGYLRILLEYIHLFHGFQPQDNISEISF